MENKRKSSKVNRENLYIHLLEKQFNLLDKTIEDAILYPKWIDEWTITKEQSLQFEKYAIALIKKVLKCNTNKAKQILGWFILNHGLRVKDDSDYGLHTKNDQMDSGPLQG